MRPTDIRLDHRVHWAAGRLSIAWPTAVSPHHSDESHVNALTAVKDVVGVLLLAFLLPVWLILGLGAAAFILTRQLYWWARGNTTAVSRSTERIRSPPLRRVSIASPRPARASDSMAAVMVPSPADAPAAGALSPAAPGVSER